jgi:hypothetical protein
MKLPGKKPIIRRKQFMFCHQCEQAAKGIGCNIQGVCGKNPDVANLQDNLLYGLKGLAFFADKARKLGAKDQEIDVFIWKGSLPPLPMWTSTRPAWKQPSKNVSR